YGPRRFRISFDEQLRPYVTGDDGKIRKTLPKPGAKDDPDLAPAAHQWFAALKKDVRTAASDQIHRLEWAMVSGPRTWTPAEFHTYIAGHPLLRHLARRLVWQSYEHFFRIAEDGTLADVHDDTFTLPEDALVWIPHPLRLREAGALTAWTELFADYEILQPFPQLGRPIYELTEEERAASHLTRFNGAKMPTGKVQGLTRYGWERGPAQDGGVAHEMTLPFHGNAGSGWIVLDLDPGIAVGAIDVLPEQTIRNVTIGPRRYTTRPDDEALTFGTLHPIAASEILAQLTDLTTN
ncbi:DUF4132 domain-containing protein, partial [Actinomadura adrarensis]